jgi:CRISPR-associated protein Cas6
VPAILPLAGKTLKLGDQAILVGTPSTRPLIPSPRLYSRLVVIKGFMEAEPFLGAVQRQLGALGVQGRLYLVEQSHIEAENREKRSGTHSTFLRRTVRIHGREVVGFAVGIEQLTAEESILVQERGIGGRRRFGCGIFVPNRR